MAEIVMTINQRKDECKDFNAIFFAVCNDHFWSSTRVDDEDCVTLAYLCSPYGTTLQTGALQVSANRLHLLTGTLHVSANRLQLLTGILHVSANHSDLLTGT